MRALFDVNVLIAQIDSEHVHYERIHEWWRLERASGWASCAITQNGFARILTRPRFARSRAPSEAIGLLGIAVGQPGHEFWPETVSIADASVFDHGKILGPKQITDIYLLALAVKNDGRLVTFDKGVPLAAVKGAEPRHLVQL